MLENMKQKSQYFFLKAHWKSEKTQLWIAWVELMSTITVSNDLLFTPSSIIDSGRPFLDILNTSTWHRLGPSVDGQPLNDGWQGHLLPPRRNCSELARTVPSVCSATWESHSSTTLWIKKCLNLMGEFLTSGLKWCTEFIFLVWT